MSLARGARSRGASEEGQGGPQYRAEGGAAGRRAGQAAEIKALEAAVENATNQLDYATLTAPFDGNVAARYVDNFQTVQAKQSIVRLLDTRRSKSPSKCRKA